MKKKIIFVLVLTLIIAFLLGGYWLFSSGRIDKKTIAISSLSMLERVAKLLPISQDLKKEAEAISQLTQALTKKDGVERRYLLMLQNNMELRPGGGFLGQYAVMRIKDGELVDLFVEDANLLDQRIEAKVTPPYPFGKMMSLKKWKFRDSNFSPDFSTNVEKAKYFLRLAGANSNFDGVIAINASVLNDALALSGPITVGGVEYNKDNGVLKLEETVEKVYLQNENLDTQNRKWVMKKLAAELAGRLAKIQNIPQLAEVGLKELRNKNIMLSFTDPQLQALAASVHWDGAVSTDWQGDYLMLVDANMGALKSDYYMKREIIYHVDLTAVPKPIATLNYVYTHTATYGDWRTSDYHSYLRAYVPKGSNLLERKMVSYPNIQEEFGKTYFGFTVHVLINRSTDAFMKYELPESVKENYKLLIQKQSGAGDIPVTVKIKTEKGELEQKGTLQKDLKFELKK